MKHIHNQQITYMYLSIFDIRNLIRIWVNQMEGINLLVMSKESYQNKLFDQIMLVQNEGSLANRSNIVKYLTHKRDALPVCRFTDISNAELRLKLNNC